MRKLAQASRLIGMTLALLVCAASAPAEAPETARVGIDTAESELVPIVETDAVCAEAAEPIFMTVIDQIQQNACGCRDLCRFDFQCGPGGSCVPVGSCGCKECVASS